MSAPPPETPKSPSLAGFRFGVRTAFKSVFAFVITVTYIGYGALCHDYGLPVGWAMLSTVLQWAGPAQVILVTALGSGTAAIETAVAVGLSSVRLLPMVVALLPMLRTERTRPWQLIVPVHFIAVSVWIESTRHAPRIPREQRIGFCNGVGVTLVLTTEDGGRGIQGRVTVPLEDALKSVGPGGAMAYACGPESMLAAVARLAAQYQVRRSWCYRIKHALRAGAHQPQLPTGDLVEHEGAEHDRPTRQGGGGRCFAGEQPGPERALKHFQ